LQGRWLTCWCKWITFITVCWL